MPDPSFTDGAAGRAGGAADYANTTTGIILMTTPFWVHLLTTVNIIAATIASVCGATMGVISVWRMIQRPKAKP